MKILFIICLMVSTAFAESPKMFFPVGKDGAKNSYKNNKAKCETLENHKCFDISGKNPAFYDVKSVLKDDLSKPIYKANYNSGSCDDADDCIQKTSSAESCETGDSYMWKENSLLPGFTYYCTRILGYEQKSEVELVLNESKKQAYEAEIQTKKALQDKIEKKYKDMSFGKRIIALVAISSDAKKLKSGQRKKLADDFESIKRLLESGSIKAARDALQGISPDGILVTEADKTSIMNEMDAYLAQ